MRQLVIMMFSVLLAGATAHAQTAPQGDPKKGQAMFFGNGGSGFCMLCHGVQAEGGFGPGLAGARGLTFEQFKRALQQPWGIMPTYPTINEDGIANLYAFLKSLPAKPEPAQWSVVNPPAGAPRGQILSVQYGCAQCHGPDMGHPRRDIGREGQQFSFADLEKIVYEKGPVQMGIYRRERLPESVLREIFDFMKAQGFRAFLWASMSAEPAGGNTTYKLTLENKGHAGKGIPADDIVVNLVLPKGASVVTTTGGSYQGVKNIDYVANPGALAPFRGLNPNPKVDRTKGDAAVWKVNKMVAGDKQVLSITLSGLTGPAKFDGSTITWGKPDIKRLPNVTLKDDRLVDRGDILWAPSPEFTVPAAPRPASE